MKRINQDISTIMLLSVLIFFLSTLVRATPASSRNYVYGATELNTPLQSYRLTLSLSNYNSTSSGTPYVTLSFSNSTLQHLLLFRWTTPQNAAFEVEYKAMTGNPHLSTGWQPLKPNVQMIPITPNVSAPNSDVIVHSATYSLRIVLKPGQTDNSLSLPLNYSMSKIGFYRIKAIVGVPNVYEFDNSVSPPALIRTFELTVCSDSILIRHITTGFVAVDSDADKHTSVK